MPIQIVIMDTHAGAAAVTAAMVRHVAPEAAIVNLSTFDGAWPEMQRIAPDVLIIDPCVPGRAGEMLIELGKVADPALRVIVLASRLTPALRRRMAELAVNVVLEKPIAPPLLLKALHNAL
jgi:DNA-binding NarL/FixJ family response regulator